MKKSTMKKSEMKKSAKSTSTPPVRKYWKVIQFVIVFLSLSFSLLLLRFLSNACVFVIETISIITREMYIAYFIGMIIMLITIVFQYKSFHITLVNIIKVIALYILLTIIFLIGILAFFNMDLFVDNVLIKTILFTGKFWEGFLVSSIIFILSCIIVSCKNKKSKKKKKVG